jgi:molecular chaperone GrpE
VSNPDEGEGIRITDNRLIDPVTGEIRHPQPSEPSGSDAADGDPAGSQVEADIDASLAELSKLTDALQRERADFANYRKRVERESELIRQMAIGSVLGEFLSVLDDLERADEHGELHGAFRTVGEALQQAVARIGLERYGSAPEPFDPEIHEALGTESREDITSPTVVTVYQPGYRYASRVLRPARVVVAGTD